MQARPILRGDLFAILDPAPGEAQLTPGRVGREGRRLVRALSRGDRSPGTPPLMALLGQIADVKDTSDPIASWRQLGHVRQNLKALAHADASAFPCTLVSERTLILPQTHKADVIRVVPAGDGRDLWFVLTREVTAAPLDAILPDYVFPEGSDIDNDSTMGPPLLAPFETTWRLFRFGERAFDIRAIMRVVQPARAYDAVHLAGDGHQIAVATTERVSIYGPDGQSVISSQLPFGRRAGEETVIAAIALDGDTLAMHLRQRPENAFEIALIDMRSRRGFPVGQTGATGSAMTLGPRHAFIYDEDHVVRMGLLAQEPDTGNSELELEPWFAEYGVVTRVFAVYGGEALWLSNGQKLLEIDPTDMSVRQELTLPEPIIGLWASGQELWLVHHDRDIARVRLSIWEREG